MDVVIYHGNRLLPGVKEFVEWLQKEEKQEDIMENRSCIQQRLDKIEAELASEISVNELAKKAGYSLFYYYHIFQKEVEMPVIQYIIRRRLLQRN